MKPRKPSKKPASATAEARRTNALLEEVRGQFKTFGEGLSSVRARVERMEPTVNHLASEFQTFKTALFEASKDIKEIKERLASVEAR